MRVAYRGATLLDGTGAPARPGMTILVEGEHIQLVIPDSHALPGTTEIVDLAGRHVIPGLIDTHQHIATPPQRSAAEAALRRNLYGGVTAIRDMADDLRQVADITRASITGEIEAPDIYYAALMAGPSFFTDPRTYQVTQGATPGEVPWMQAITPDTDLPLAVAMARGTFATAIKIYADLPAQTVAAITAEAHRQGIAAWAHAAVFPATPGQVIDAGVDVISHVHLLVHEAAPRPLTTYHDKPPADRERFTRTDDPVTGQLFARMRDRGTILDATASLWSRVAREAREPRVKQEAADNDAISAALTTQAAQAGVTICAGTDTDPDLTSRWPPLFDELAYLVERCGLTPGQALDTATRHGAMSLCKRGLTGTLEPGQLASFVILTEDPARDLANLRTVTTVVKRGRQYHRASYQHPENGAARP